MERWILCFDLYTARTVAKKKCMLTINFRLFCSNLFIDLKVWKIIPANIVYIQRKKIVLLKVRQSNNYGFPLFILVLMSKMEQRWEVVITLMDQVRGLYCSLRICLRDESRFFTKMIPTLICLPNLLLGTLLLQVKQGKYLIFDVVGCYKKP